jgi:hypothetical protein
MAGSVLVLDDFSVFEEPSFRAELAGLVESTREASRRYAADAELIARLAARVPRRAGDERGGTPWTSFLREVAVARRCSDLAASAEVRRAVRLVACHPRALELLWAGELPVARVQALVDALELARPADAREVEADLAQRACALPPWRIRQAATKALLALDADAAAAREAHAARARAVRLSALPDGQAEIAVTGPAVPVVSWFDALTRQARALQAAGDPRGLDALRFDLALGQPTAPAAPTSAGDPAAAAAPADPAHAAVPADLAGPGGISDRRRRRPVQVIVQVPVTTALGLSNEPGWLDGYGWISAPQCRTLLPTAELRQACVDEHGQLVDLADRPVRPAPTPEAVRDALLTMATDPVPLSDTATDEQPQHDPTPQLARYVQLSDQFCDGPTGTRILAQRCDLDHDRPWPTGPTAAWNLIVRSRRTHALKHRGWTPLRTPDSTLWISPAGQTVLTPRHLHPPPELHPTARPPDPAALHQLDTELTRQPDPTTTHPGDASGATRACAPPGRATAGRAGARARPAGRTG